MTINRISVSKAQKLRLKEKRKERKKKGESKLKSSKEMINQKQNQERWIGGCRKKKEGEGAEI